MLFHREGIVIRTMDYGEGNKIIVIYTKENGKVSVMVRGAKKIKSRHSAIAQIFTYAHFHYYKSGQMGTLNYGDIIKPYHRLREDLHLSAHAAYVMELIDKLLDEQEGSQYLFNQLLACMDALEEGKQPHTIVHIFELKVLAAAGYTPQYQACISCDGTDLLDGFSVAAGGVLCRKCYSQDPQAMPIPAKIRKLFVLLQQVDLQRVGNIDVSPETVKAVQGFMRAFMDHHTGIRWKTRAFFDQMEKYGL